MRLTTRFMLLAIIVLVLVVAAIWEADPSGSWRVLVLMLVAGLLWEWWWLRGTALTMRIEALESARLGKPLPLRVQLTSSQTPRVLQVRHRLQGPASVPADVRDVHLEVAPAAVASYLTHAQPRRLGAARFPSQWLEVRGPLGLASWMQQVPLDLELRVAPTRLSDRSETTGGATGWTRRRATVGDGTEILGLRDARADDPVARFDWKASARRGRPVIRETEAESQLEIVVAIDAGLGAGVEQGMLTRFGHAANVAARLAEYADEGGDRVGVVVFADRVLAQVAPGRGALHQNRVRSVLAAHDAQDRESNPLQAMLEVRAMVRHRSLVVLFSDFDDPEGAGQLVAATRLLRPIHLPLIAAVRDEETAGLKRRLPADWRDSWSAIAAVEIDRSIRSTQLRLRQLGAEVVHERADELDAALRRRYTRLRSNHRV